MVRQARGLELPPSETDSRGETASLGQLHFLSHSHVPTHFFVWLNWIRSSIHGLYFEDPDRYAVLYVSDCCDPKQLKNYLLQDRPRWMPSFTKQPQLVSMTAKYTKVNNAKSLAAAPKTCKNKGTPFIQENGLAPGEERAQEEGPASPACALELASSSRFQLGGSATLGDAARAPGSPCCWVPGTRYRVSHRDRQAPPGLSGRG